MNTLSLWSNKINHIFFFPGGYIEFNVIYIFTFQVDGNDNAGPYIAGFCEKVNMANRQITVTDDEHDEDIHDTE